jgi:hypothetical protein
MSLTDKHSVGPKHVVPQMHFNFLYFFLAMVDPILSYAWDPNALQIVVVL